MSNDIKSELPQTTIRLLVNKYGLISGLRFNEHSPDLVFGQPEVVRIKANGGVVIAEGAELDDAARAFWNVVAEWRGDGSRPTLADAQPGGRVRLGDEAPTHDQQTIERVAKAMQASEQAQSGWTWADCSPIEVEGWMDLARAAVAAIPASQPVREQRAALWVQFAENGNMQFFTRDPDRAVEESFCYARPLTAYYEKPFPIEDLSRFKDLIGFAAWQAIQLPETDPRRDFIRQSNELIRIIDSAKEISK